MSKMMSVQFASSSIVKSAGTLYSVVKVAFLLPVSRIVAPMMHATGRALYLGTWPCEYQTSRSGRTGIHLNTAPRLGEVSHRPRGDM